MSPSSPYREFFPRLRRQKLRDWTHQVQPFQQHQKLAAFVLVKTSQKKNQQKKKLKHLIQGLTAVVEKQKKEKILLLLVMVNGSSCNGCLAEFCAPAQKETVEAPVASSSVGRLLMTITITAITLSAPLMLPTFRLPPPFPSPSFSVKHQLSFICMFYAP